MIKDVKFRCKVLSEGFVSKCEVENVQDFENPNLFKVTRIYNKSCALYQLCKCNNQDCVFALGDNFNYFSHADENSIDCKGIF